MDKKPVTDLSFLRDVAMDDDSIVIETIDAFIADIPKALENLSKHHKNGEWQLLYKQAHKIKPNLKYMGMERAGDLIIDIEREAKEGEISDDLGEKITEFQVICYRALDELSQKLTALKE